MAPRCVQPQWGPWMTSNWIARAFATLSPGKKYIVGSLVNINFWYLILLMVQNSGDHHLGCKNSWNIYTMEFNYTNYITGELFGFLNHQSEPGWCSAFFRFDGDFVGRHFQAFQFPGWWMFPDTLCEWMCERWLQESVTASWEPLKAMVVRRRRYSPFLFWGLRLGTFQGRCFGKT